MIMRRIFFTALLSSAFFVSGCSESESKPFVGYWLQQTEDRPVSLHIKESGNDVQVKIGQLVFGRYETVNEQGVIKKGTLNIGNEKILKLDQNSLVDIDDPNVIFRPVSESAYLKEISSYE